jgi:DNA modification methylase
MEPLREQEKKQLIDLIEAGKPLPPVWKARLFPSDEAEYVEATKVYQLVYAGKTPKQRVIGETASAPFQEVRAFNADNPFPDSAAAGSGERWRNLLIYGDNLLALKTLYDDQRGENRYGTKDRIKLVYIDPPFATRQDFMKDREKAYRDKVIGAQFIEFLRKRLILLREILADDGSIYVHLDWKKGHYIKAVLDEVFGEENFLNEIAWKRTYAHSDANRFGQVHDVLLFYRKSDPHMFQRLFREHSESYIRSHYGQIDKDGRRFRLVTLSAAGPGPARKFGDRTIAPPPGRHWAWSQDRIDRGLHDGKIVFANTGQPNIKQFLDDVEGTAIQSVWDDIPPVNPVSSELTGYPTQKAEGLLQRVIQASSTEGDIVLDAFAGSGTTAAVAEKLGRRWIAMDCGRLAIYTTERRLLEMTTRVGASPTDGRQPHDRISDFVAHAKSPTHGLLMVYEKAKAGSLDITDELLRDLAAFVGKHMSGKKARAFSLVCPRDKFKVRELEVEEPGEDDKAGEQVVEVEGVRFLISFIEPKQKAEKPKPLKAKEFVLLNAGVYDNEQIKAMSWAEYKPFVMKLFGVREEPHRIHAFDADGYIGTDSAYVWNYPESKKLTIDEEYVATLHKALGGRAGDRFFVIAPVVSMGFMMDEIVHGETTYVFLKVPISILRRLLEGEEHGAIKQPVSEADVNEVIDAVGFDFVSQPVVKRRLKRLKPANQDLLNRNERDFTIRLTDFRSNTLATDPEDFGKFETLSMILVDTDFKGDVFRLGKVFWAEELVKAELARQKVSAPGGHAEATALCKWLDARISESEFAGKQMMAIFIDKYGNEKKERYKKADFK